jgi:hypothetical protein
MLNDSRMFGTALSLLALAQGMAPSDVPPSSAFGYKTKDAIEIEDRYYILGHPDQAAGAKTVYIDYLATLSGPREEPVTTAMLKVPTDYWVTATAVIDDDHIAVAGQVGQGGTVMTVVEVWTLRRPTVDLVTDPVTQERRHVMDVGGVADRQRILSVDADGRRGVRRLVKLRGKPSSLLIQFHDSGDLYELNSAAVPATLTKLFSPADGGGVPVVAALAETRLKWIDGRTHSTQGYIYVFYPAATPDDRGDDPLTFAMFDRNRDGSIETWEWLDFEELAQFYADGYEEIRLATQW